MQRQYKHLKALDLGISDESNAYIDVAWIVEESNATENAHVRFKAC
jgi:hypothetical protein